MNRCGAFSVYRRERLRQRPSPYGVLGGVAIEDRDVWNLIKAMPDAEVQYFGTRYSAGQTELKAKKPISAQVFRQGALAGEIAFQERTELAKRCLERGAGAPPRDRGPRSGKAGVRAGGS
jgi:hypothetical protein